MKIVLASDHDEELWAHYLQARPEPTFHHQYKWKKVIEDSFNRKSYYLMAIEGNQVHGVLPLFLSRSFFLKNSLISIPFLNYGGLIADNEVVATMLIDKAKEVADQESVSYIELRHLQRYESAPITNEHKVTFWLELLAKIEAQWKAIDPKIRNQVRKAEKNHVLVAYGKEELLDEFYRVFSRNMRDLGTPVLGKLFFENILKHFQDESFIFVAKYREKPIAGAFVMAHDGVMEIPWASSIHSFNKLCANVMLYWHIIKHAVSLECHYFDFGRCSKGSGSYDFKKQWGAKQHQLYWQYWGRNPVSIPTFEQNKAKYKSLPALWRMLPLPFANRLGPIVAKCLPYY